MNDLDWDSIVKAGWLLKNDRDKMLTYFSEIVSKFPDNARAHFEYANALDYSDLELKAISHYQRSLELGIEWPLKLFTLIQLGSSLRNVGRILDALSVLKQAYDLRPDYPPTAIFYSLALSSAGKTTEALQYALNFIVEQASTEERQRYGEPLQRYISNVHDPLANKAVSSEIGARKATPESQTKSPIS